MALLLPAGATVAEALDRFGDTLSRAEARALTAYAAREAGAAAMAAARAAVACCIVIRGRRDYIRGLRPTG